MSMQRFLKDSESKLHQLLPYTADLELEVDRLRKQGEFVEHEVLDTLKQIQMLLRNATQSDNAQHTLAEIDRFTKQLAGVLRDLHEPAGYHPAHDQVVAIALRPLIEQVFRWQQRLEGAQSIKLQLELESEHVEWFPARLRHILDNLLSNAVRYSDSNKSESWVRVGLRLVPKGYEMRISDNGQGMPWEVDRVEVFELFYRAAPARAAGLGVGLAVVKMLVEQSGGSLQVDSGEGQGTTFVVVLPRYDIDDFLTEDR
jgi:signal transduction histidine kinase